MGYVRYAVMHVHVATSWPVTTVWVLLSFLVSVMCAVAFAHPEWYVREDSRHLSVLRYDRSALLSTLGMVNVCYRRPRPWAHFHCHNFGEDFPSTTWQTAYVMYGTGCVLLAWCGLLAFCGLWIVGHRNRQLLALLVGRIQLIAVILQTGALLLYPMVLGTPFVHVHCGSRAEVYSPDECRLGWAYMAAITGTVLAYYCPLLAHFTAYNVYSPCYWTDI